jgi:hypothetical protein
VFTSSSFFWVMASGPPWSAPRNGRQGVSGISAAFAAVSADTMKWCDPFDRTLCTFTISTGAVLGSFTCTHCVSSPPGATGGMLMLSSYGAGPVCAPPAPAPAAPAADAPPVPAGTPPLDETTAPPVPTIGTPPVPGVAPAFPAPPEPALTGAPPAPGAPAVGFIVPAEPAVFAGAE